MSPKTTASTGASDGRPYERDDQVPPGGAVPGDPAAQRAALEATQAETLNQSAEGGDQEWDGNSSLTSTEKQQTTTGRSSLSGQSPAPTTENPSETDQTASGTAPSTGGETTDGEVTGEYTETAPYEEWTNEALQDEIRRRNEVREADGRDRLPVTGNKAELVERLEDDDTDPDR
jgi:hypothetical protein